MLCKLVHSLPYDNGYLMTHVELFVVEERARIADETTAESITRPNEGN